MGYPRKLRACGWDGCVESVGAGIRSSDANPDEAPISPSAMPSEYNNLTVATAKLRAFVST